MRTERIAGLAVGALAFALSANASAFCRTTTCTPKTCQPSPDCGFCMEGGLPLYWPGGCTSFSIQKDGSPLRGIDAATTLDLVATGLAQWMSVDCGGGAHPSILIYKASDGFVTCHRQEYNQESGNANIWMYRDDSWPYTGSGYTLALTTVTYNVNTGQIFDADVEINSAQQPLTVGDQNIQADLLSIVTHESGHFLGLSHSCDSQATMFATYQFGDTSLRSLAADDIAGICEIYPPGTDTSKCDPTPRHGFASDCGSDPTSKGCCTTAPGRPGSDGVLAIAASMTALGLGAARRRRRRA